MKTLIAVISCHAQKFRDLAYAQRQTWVPRVDWADVKFFLGSSLNGHPMGGYSTSPDEVWLDVDDSYTGLPAKVKAMFGWAAEHNYDRVFKTDDDVWLNPYLLKQCQTSDYAGRIREASGAYPASYASGFAYWLSKRACELVADGPLNKDWAEDRYIGNLLAMYGINPLRDTNSYMPAHPPLMPEVIFRTNIRHRAVYCEFSTPKLIHDMELFGHAQAHQFERCQTNIVPQVAVTMEQFMREPDDMPMAFKLAQNTIPSRVLCPTCGGRGCDCCRMAGWVQGRNPIIVSA